MSVKFLVQQTENISATLSKRFFDYSMLKLKENLIQSNDIIKEYKSGIADPCRYAALFERILTRKN